MEAVKTDYRQAELSEVDRGMLDFAAKLTRTPADVGRPDISKLRGIGFDDGAIHDIVQITSLFNYYNRLADGMGIDMEPEFGPRS